MNKNLSRIGAWYILFILLNYILESLTGIDAACRSLGLYAKVNQVPVWPGLITYSLIHVSLWHLMANVVPLISLSYLLSRYWGSNLCVLVYILPSMAGGVMYYYLSDNIAVGSSATVFGLLGFLLIGSMRIMFSKIDLFALFIWSYCAIMVAFINKPIGHVAHLGGFMTGAVLSYALKPGPIPNIDTNQPRKTQFGFLMALGTWEFCVLLYLL